MRVLIQHQDTPCLDTIGAAIESRLSGLAIDSVHAAMAYVSIAGVRTLLALLPNRPGRTSQWLLGLDDCLTQPGAIELLLKLDRAEVRVATLASMALRFHPKVLHFQSRSATDVLMVGSANLTGNALQGNCEAVVFLEAEDRREKSVFTKVWADLWAQGHKPSAKELAKYKRCYEEARQQRTRIQQRLSKGKRASKGKLILEGDDAELDPASAATCWIECGSVTALGRELEFKAEQGWFFGLNPTGGSSKTFAFRTSAGAAVPLKIKYQENHMWRLQMNNQVPEVKAGLRPRRRDGSLGRSKYVAVFTRTDDPELFDLRFINLRSKLFKRLEGKSRRYGTLGHTTARSYGWC